MQHLDMFRSKRQFTNALYQLSRWCQLRNRNISSNNMLTVTSFYSIYFLRKIITNKKILFVLRFYIWVFAIFQNTHKDSKQKASLFRHVPYNTYVKTINKKSIHITSIMLKSNLEYFWWCFDLFNST